jgi:hypothetical protein
VPVGPLVPPPLLPPPQAMNPMERNRSKSPINATRFFRFRGLTTSNPKANVAALAEGQKGLLF